MELTEFLAKGVKESGFQLVTEPQLNIVAFNSKDMTVWQIADRLDERGWAVSISSYPQAIRIIVMPHLKKEHIISFLTDLREIR